MNPQNSVLPYDRAVMQFEPAMLLRAYFDTINDADFEATASLFAVDGTLYPPFGYSVVGRDAIATYLAKEAVGMNLCPDLAQATEPVEETEGLHTLNVSGKVQTSFFSVGVKWTFVLSASGDIHAVHVRLLAGLEELLHLKASSNGKGETARIG
jgi:hypothetical protein